MMVARYAGHGLIFESDIALVEFSPAPDGAGADVVVTTGALPGAAAREAERRRAESPAAMARLGEGDPPVHLVAVREVADFLISGGREIRVAPAPGAAEGMLRVWMHGSAIGMLMHQRGTLVLHGAAVHGRRGVAVFVGDSGSGKSTLAAHLGRAGLPVLGDDTLAVHDPGGAPAVWPGSRRLKLWRDAIEGLGIGIDGDAALAHRIDKYWVDCAEAAPHESLPLSDVFELGTGVDPAVEPLGLLEAAALIAGHTYRPEFVAATGREAAHFRQCAALAGRVRVARLCRPWDPARIGETVGFIAELLEAGA